MAQRVSPGAIVLVPTILLLLAGCSTGGESSSAVPGPGGLPVTAFPPVASPPAPPPTGTPGPPPGAPRALTVTVKSATTVDLTWTDGSDDESGFRIERSLDGNAWDIVSSVNSNVFQFSDVHAPPGRRLFYRVLAFSTAGETSSDSIELTTFPLTTAWRTVGRDVQHTGYNPEEWGTPPLTPSWNFQQGASPINPVVVDESQRTYLTSNGYFRDSWAKALTPQGQESWSKSWTDVYSVGQPAVFDNRLYVPQCDHSTNSFLWCFNPANGAENWATPLSAQWETYWAPVFGSGKIFVNSGYYGGLYGTRAEDGSSGFFQPLEQYDSWSPAYQDGVVYSFVMGKFRAHNTDSGAVDWTLDLAWDWRGYDMDTYPVLAEGKAFVVRPPQLVAVNLASHDVAWKNTGFAFQGAPAYHNGVVYALSAGTLKAANSSSGAVQWSFVGDTQLRYPPVIANGYVYVSSDSNVYAVNIATHQQSWTAPVGGWLTLANGRLYVAGGTGVLSTFTLTRL